YVDVRRLRGRDAPGLDGLEAIAPLGIRAGAAAAEAGEAARLGFFARGDEATPGIGVTDLDHRVVDRLAVAVEHAPGEEDVLARRERLGEHGPEGRAEGVAVLLGGEAVGEVRADGLRRGLSQRLHRWRHLRVSMGVSCAPRRTMSNA